MIRTRSTFAAPLLAALATIVLLLALPGTGSYALWSAPLPLTGTVTTGDLGLDDEVITGGTWTRDGEHFDPAEDTVTSNDELTLTVEDVPVTAVGENLRASFQDVRGTDLPGGVELAVTSDPSTVQGTGADAGSQLVDLILTVRTTDLAEGTESLDLSSLVVTFGNGAGWTDTARLDAGTLAVQEEQIPPGEGRGLQMRFDLSQDADGVIGFYLQGVAEGTIIRWGVWENGQEVTTKAVNGLNSMQLSGEADGWVRIEGGFRGMGDCSQSADLVGALVSVQGWTAEYGSTDGSCAFLNATHLGAVNDLPATLTDASSMFRGAGTESSSFWPDLYRWDSSHVTDMSGMFRDSGLVRFDGQLDTSSVTDMSYMFAGATSFVGPANLSSAARVTTMQGMFQGATAYTGREWSDWASGVDAPRLVDMSHMFEGASAFDATLQNWDVPKVQAMDRMLWGASSFTQDLSGWDVRSVTSWEDFADDDGLPQEKWPRFGGESLEASDDAESDETSADDAEAEEKDAEADAEDADDAAPDEPADQSAAGDGTAQAGQQAHAGETDEETADDATDDTAPADGEQAGAQRAADAHETTTTEETDDEH